MDFFSGERGESPPSLMENWYLCSPFQKLHKMSQLTSEQRYTISVMYKQGFAQKVIAVTINKDRSVVSRELKRNRNDLYRQYIPKGGTSDNYTEKHHSL